MLKPEDLSVERIRNLIWLADDCGQPLPGTLTVESLREELERRGLEPRGYHNA